MRKLLITILAASAFAVPLSAEDPCPCIPLPHVWIVKTCADWNCANAELVPANGDPQVIAVPAGLNDRRWLIVRRVVSGASIEDPNDDYRLQQFDGLDPAVACYRGFEAGMRPQLLTAPDGQVLVIALRQPEDATRRRAAHP